MKRFLVGTIATIGILGTAAPTLADPITYTETSIASGSLGGTTFTDALITLTLIGDTTGVVQPLPDELPDFRYNPGTATITIAGLGTATIFNGTAIFFPVIPGEIPLPSFGIGQGLVVDGHFTGILGIGSDSLAGYDLQSSFGPFSAAGSAGATEPNGSPHFYATSSGNLMLTGGENVTLTVTTTSVPEPASLSLIGTGGLSLLALRRRTKRRA
jgi:hypothetical protein